MGKLGRFACIFTPMVLTLASLLCLVLVFSGQLNKGNSIQRDLFFFKAITKDFNNDPFKDFPDVPNTELDNKLLKALQDANTKKKLKDFYQVGLWNYCEGDIAHDGKETITYCSPRKAKYWFNPVDVWEFDDKDQSSDKVFTDDFNKVIDTYHKVAGWMFTAYIIAAIATAAEFIVGIFAIFSRWGSFVTTIVATVQMLFTIAAVGTSTGIYASLVGVFQTVLKPLEVRSFLGSKMLAVSWLAVAFSLAAGFFWLISTCCCSGSSGTKKVVVEKTPYTYERVASPYMGASGNAGAGAHQMHAMPPASGHGTSGSAYEPFRHQGSAHV